MRRDMATRFCTFLRLRPMTLPPEISLLGVNPNHEANWCSVANAVRSVPSSERIVCAPITSIPSIEVRSTPEIRFSSAAKSIAGALPLGFFGFWAFRATAVGLQVGLVGDLDDSSRQHRQIRLQLPIAF